MPDSGSAAEIKELKYFTSNQNYQYNDSSYKEWYINRLKYLSQLTDDITQNKEDEFWKNLGKISSDFDELSTKLKENYQTRVKAEKEFKYEYPNEISYFINLFTNNPQNLAKILAKNSQNPQKHQGLEKFFKIIDSEVITFKRDSNCVEYGIKFADALKALEEKIFEDTTKQDQLEKYVQKVKSEHKELLVKEYYKSSEWNGWHNPQFFTNVRREQEYLFKINIQVHADDLSKAVEVLIKKGLLLDEEKWGPTEQKVASYYSNNLSIILYQDKDGNQEKWNERINALEVDLFEAGVRPRALNKSSSRGSVINDKKIQGAIYSYYKKDDDFKWDPNSYGEDYNYSKDLEIASFLEANKENYFNLETLKSKTGKGNLKQIDGIVILSDLFEESGQSRLKENYQAQFREDKTYYITFGTYGNRKYFEINSQNKEQLREIITNLNSIKEESVGLWKHDKGVVGKVVVDQLSRKIKEKIALIEGKLRTELSQKEDLESLKSAYEFYQEFLQLKDEDAQKIQHNKKKDGTKPDKGEKGLKDKLNEANRAIGAKHHLLNVEVKMSNILDTTCQAIVNAGNYNLDNGRYGIRGLSKEVHDEIDGTDYTTKESTNTDGTTSYFRAKAQSPFCDALVEAAENDGALDNPCHISLYLYQDQELQNPLLEANQAINQKGQPLFLKKNEQGKELQTTERTSKTYHQQETTTVECHRLKKDEVVLVDLKTVGGVKEGSKLKDKTIIHAVGPDYRDHNIKKLSSNARKRKLKEIYQKALDKAYDHGIKTIALPVLSVGVFEFPAKEAAEVVADILKANCTRFEKIAVCDQNTDINKANEANEETDAIKLIKENLALSQAKPNYDLVDQLKAGFEKSLTPKRYQATLSILTKYCDVQEGQLPQNLKEYLDNPGKFKGIDFDFDTSYDGNIQLEEKRLDLVEFNKRCYDFLAQNNNVMWQEIANFAKKVALAKDLSRIKEKFRLDPNDEKFKKVKSIFEKFYDENCSDQDLETKFKELKKIIIAARLEKKLGNYITEKQASQLASNFIDDGRSLEKIKNDSSLNNKLSPEKIEAIFTKFVTLGKIKNLEDLKLRIYGKKEGQFQEIFSEEILLLDQINKPSIKLSGNETLFRGIWLPPEKSLEEQKEIIRQSFLSANIPQAKSAIREERQGLGSFQIFDNRPTNPVGEGTRASYAIATSTNPLTALDYAVDKGNTEYGWVYEIRPQKGKSAVLVGGIYNEVDFSEIKPEEIYAVYCVKLTKEMKLTDSSGVEEVKYKSLEIVEEIPNPHFKKRECDKKVKTSEGKDQVTRENLLSKITQEQVSAKLIIGSTPEWNEWNFKKTRQTDGKSPEAGQGKIDIRKEAGESFNSLIPKQNTKKEKEGSLADPSTTRSESSEPNTPRASSLPPASIAPSSSSSSKPSASPRTITNDVILGVTIYDKNSARENGTRFSINGEENRKAGSYFDFSKKEREDKITSQNLGQEITNKLIKIIENVVQAANDFGCNKEDLIKLFTFAYHKGGLSNQAISDQERKYDGINHKMIDFSQKFQELCAKQDNSIFSAHDKKTGMRTRRFGDVFGGEGGIRSAINELIQENNQSNSIEGSKSELKITDQINNKIDKFKNSLNKKIESNAVISGRSLTDSRYLNGSFYAKST